MASPFKCASCRSAGRGSKVVSSLAAGRHRLLRASAGGCRPLAPRACEALFSFLSFPPFPPTCIMFTASSTVVPSTTLSSTCTTYSRLRGGQRRGRGSGRSSAARRQPALSAAVPLDAASSCGFPALLLRAACSQACTSAARRSAAATRALPRCCSSGCVTAEAHHASSSRPTFTEAHHGSCRPACTSPPVVIVIVQHHAIRRRAPPPCLAPAAARGEHMPGGARGRRRPSKPSARSAHLGLRITRGCRKHSQPAAIGQRGGRHARQQRPAVAAAATLTACLDQAAPGLAGPAPRCPRIQRCEPPRRAATGEKILQGRGASGVAGWACCWASDGALARPAIPQGGGCRSLWALPAGVVLARLAQPCSKEAGMVGIERHARSSGLAGRQAQDRPFTWAAGAAQTASILLLLPRPTRCADLGWRVWRGRQRQGGALRRRTRRALCRSTCSCFAPTSVPAHIRHAGILLIGAAPITLVPLPSSLQAWWRPPVELTALQRLRRGGEQTCGRIGSGSSMQASLSVAQPCTPFTRSGLHAHVYTARGCHGSLVFEVMGCWSNEVEQGGRFLME